MVYPHKWSPISCKSSAGLGKFVGERLAFYHCAMQSTAPQNSLLPASVFIPLDTSLLAPQTLHLQTLCVFINFTYLHRTYLQTNFPCPGWLRSTVGRTLVFGRRTDPVLRSACSRRVTIMWVNRPLQVSQLGQLSLSSFRGR